MDPDKTQRIPVMVNIIAVVVVTDEAAKDQAIMLAAISKNLLASLGRIPYIASVEAIRVSEVQPAVITGRTQ